MRNIVIGIVVLLLVLLSSLTLELHELMKEPTLVHALLMAFTLVGLLLIGLQLRREPIRQG